MDVSHLRHFVQNLTLSSAAPLAQFSRLRAVRDCLNIRAITFRCLIVYRVYPEISKLGDRWSLVLRDQTLSQG